MDPAFYSGVADALDSSLECPLRPAAVLPDQNEAATDVTLRTLPIGTILFRVGEPKTCLYQIVAGVVCMYRPRPGGVEYMIDFVLPGDVLGLGYLDYYIHCARAAAETRVRCLPRPSLGNIVRYDPRARRRHAETLDREFAHSRDLLSTDNRQRPVGRVAAFLLAVSQFNEYEGRNPNIVTDALSCGVVAGWLKLDLDLLRQILVELERKRLIEPGGAQGLRLLDLAGLAARAGGGTL